MDEPSYDLKMSVSFSSALLLTTQTILDLRSVTMYWSLSKLNIKPLLQPCLQPKHDVFLNVTKWFSCLNITGASSQCGEKRKPM